MFEYRHCVAEYEYDNDGFLTSMGVRQGIDKSGLSWFETCDLICKTGSRYNHHPEPFREPKRTAASAKAANAREPRTSPAAFEPLIE